MTYASPYVAAGVPVCAKGFAHAIIERIAAKVGVTLADVLGRRRTHLTVRARHAGMYWLHHGLKLGVTEIGRITNRDHTTVIAALKSMEGRKEVDSEFAAWLQSIRPIQLLASAAAQGVSVGGLDTPAGVSPSLGQIKQLRPLLAEVQERASAVLGQQVLITVLLTHAQTDNQ